MALADRLARIKRRQELQANPTEEPMSDTTPETDVDETEPVEDDTATEEPAPEPEPEA